MGAITPRDVVVNLVRDYCAATGKTKDAWRVWGLLYDKFDPNLRREAYNSDQDPLVRLVQTRRIGDFMVFVEKLLKPALPEKEKAPVQGSFKEEDLYADDPRVS